MPPASSTSSFSADVFLVPGTACGWSPSASLTALLIAARNEYDWPSGTGAAASQLTIQRLEASVAVRMASLSQNDANHIAIDVSRWAGNNQRSHNQLISSSATSKALIHQAIGDFSSSETMRRGVETLCNVPGLSLVIASKIFRFCAPDVGVAIDRHASYFTNSLRTDNGVPTQFAREWTNGKRRATRLAIYTASGLRVNVNEYFRTYLPLLTEVSANLNSAGSLYKCAVFGAPRRWRPADVEMAAYYWWAQHGQR